MKPVAFLVPATLFILAGFAGLEAEEARDEAGIVRSVARIPLGGLEPLAVDLLYFRANAQIREYRLPEAVATIRLITELHPRIVESWSYLGWYLAWRNSESAATPEEEWKFIAEGLEVLKRGLEYNPESPHLRLVLSQLYYARMMGQEDVRPLAERELGAPPAKFAMEAYRRVVELEPNDLYRAALAESARQYALRLLELGRKGEALPVLRESRFHFDIVGQDPEWKRAKERVEEIDRLIGEIEDD